MLTGGASSAPIVALSADAITPIAVSYCWASVPAPDTGHNWTYGSVQAVSTLAPNDVWVLTTYQDAQATAHTVAASWNGIHWSVVSTLSTGVYHDMTAISDNDIWVVGDGGIAMHWDGSHWTVYHISNPNLPVSTLYAVDASSSNNVWAVGDGPGNEDVIWGVVLHWNGTQWSGVTPYDGYCVQYRSVKVASQSSVWVGGHTESTGCIEPGGTAVLMYWNGMSWVDGGLPQTYGMLTAIGQTSLTDVWVSVRGSNGSPSQFYYSDGTYWAGVPSQGFFANHIEPISRSDVWATTSDLETPIYSGTLLHWDGDAWGRVDFLGDNITDLGAISSNDIWAVGSTLLPNDSRMLTLHYNTSCIPTPAPIATATPTLVPPPCPGEHFTDVCPDEYFYSPVQALTNDGILYGYASSPPCRNALWIPCFNPNNPSTRGQISKIVSLAANFDDDVSSQTFEDVAPGSRFYTYTERMAERGIIGGYPCGGPNEPCVPPGNRPYFRTNNNVSRGQLSKMVALAFQWNDPPTGQTFEDVLPGSAFYTYTVQLYNRGIINGYPCGGPGEACHPPVNRPYFRPGNNVLRGQTAKIVQLARTQPSPTPTATATLTAVATSTATPAATSTIPVATHTPTPVATIIASPTEAATSTDR